LWLTRLHSTQKKKQAKNLWYGQLKVERLQILYHCWYEQPNCKVKPLYTSSRNRGRQCRLMSPNLYFKYNRFVSRIYVFVTNMSPWTYINTLNQIMIRKMYKIGQCWIRARNWRWRLNNMNLPSNHTGITININVKNIFEFVSRKLEKISATIHAAIGSNQCDPCYQ
jgi:hypothetical protein